MSKTELDQVIKKFQQEMDSFYAEQVEDMSQAIEVKIKKEIKAADDGVDGNPALPQIVNGMPIAAINTVQ